MIFGRKDVQGKTVLVLDIESGSVGAALARVEQGGALRLLGEYRRYLPVRATRDADTLARDTEALLADAIARMSELAARLRQDYGGQARSTNEGDISRIAAFMSPPWGRPNLALGAPEFVPHMTDIVRTQLSPYFELTPHFHTNAGAAAAGLRTLVPLDHSLTGETRSDKYLICIVGHEMTELLLVNNGSVAGHATIPHGINLPLRTIRSHGDISEHEARSLLRLSAETHAAPHDTPWHGALGAAGDLYRNEFRDVAQGLFGEQAPEHVWVISSAGEHFARLLSHDSLADLFPQGGVVRALGAQHVRAHIDGPSNDLFLMLQALFIRYT